MQLEMRMSKLTYQFLLLSAILAAYFWIAVKSGKPLSFDRMISSFMTGVFTDYSYPFFTFMDRLGSTFGVGIVSLIFVGWLWLKQKNYLAMAVLALAVAIGNEVNKWLKDLVGRPRPELEHMVNVKSLSFPSGHAMIGMILYMLIAYFIIRDLNARGAKWVTGILAGIWIFLMGISRIVMQVHYPSDVVAGFAFGFIWTFFWIAFYEIRKVSE
jgi:membrane-associated phospholipid phosphatase